MARFRVLPHSTLRRKVRDFDLRLLETDQGPLSCECGAEMVFEWQDAVIEDGQREIRVTGTPCYRCPRCGQTIWNGLVQVRCQELAFQAKRRWLVEIPFYVTHTWRRRRHKLLRTVTHFEFDERINANIHRIRRKQAREEKRLGLPPRQIGERLGRSGDEFMKKAGWDESRRVRTPLDDKEAPGGPGR